MWNLQQLAHLPAERNRSLFAENQTGAKGAASRATKDDIASTAFRYQTEPHRPFPSFPSEAERYVSTPIDWDY